MHPITIIERVWVGPEGHATLLPHLERTEDRVWLTRHIVCDRYTLRGVPGRLVTVDVARDLGGDCLVLEIARKRGRYDGAQRDSLTLRPWEVCRDGAGRPNRYETPKGLREVRTQGKLTVERWDAPQPACQVIVSWHPSPGDRPGDYFWHSPIYPVLRSALADYDLRSIVLWHWRRYYAMLPAPEVLALADAFEAAHPDARLLTLAEANRLASRDLYRLARDLGWRKLTARERHRHGIDQMWVRADTVPARSAAPAPAVGTPTGAGQYSIDAAQGRPMRPVVEVE